METAEQKRLIETLKNNIDKAILPYVSKLDNLIILDFPNYANVGDSAIYLGELEFFRKNMSIRPSVVSDTGTVPWNHLGSSGSTDPIFLCGGGNFGDLWPHHQQLRESVLKRFPGRLVIQLPQSIHYNDPGAIARTAEVIKGHGNFVLLVRDDASYALAKENFRCEIQRCPDMAFYLGSLKAPRPPEHELLLLMRTDREKRKDLSDGSIDLPAGSIVADWVHDDKSMKLKTKTSTVAKAILGANFSEMAMRVNYYDQLARQRLDRGIKLLSSSRFIITDRLHVHIMSVLLNIPQVVLDNSYGKVSRFIGLWTEGFSNMQRADSLPRALEIYRNSRLK